MAMDDLWEMDDRQLWARGLYRFRETTCACGPDNDYRHSHQWRGEPFGGWTDQDGVVVMCNSPVNTSARRSA